MGILIERALYLLLLWDKWVRGVWLLPKLECYLKGIQYILEYIGRGSKPFDQPLKLGHANVIKLFLGIQYTCILVLGIIAPIWLDVKCDW